MFEQKARLPRTRTSFDTGLRYYSLGGELKNFSNREKRKKFLVWGLRKRAKLFMMRGAERLEESHGGLVRLLGEQLSSRGTVGSPAHCPRVFASGCNGEDPVIPAVGM